ncbi:membrane or secreted protein [Paucihalobacter sp.]|uniref:membrane or secreted protein n=1 Tax=Paucihalobacter sp. TaxID=2850405 RepID=UPI002FE248EF
MKHYIIILICLGSFGLLKAQSVIGAWEGNYTAEDGIPLKSVVIFADGYQVLTTYNARTGEFLNTNGGTWSLEDNIMSELVEFNTEAPETVGETFSFEVSITDTTLQIVGTEMQFKRIDSGAPGALQGAWLMSGRMRDGETEMRNTNTPRKTMKILSGTRFQWIAYNTETKQFMGTGGGTYITKDGIYTENIEFFSRDISRVGASLEFNYELKDGNWHHSGLSSKGDPIYEIWSLRE